MKKNKKQIRDEAFINGWAAAANASIKLAMKQNTWTPELREMASVDACLKALDAWIEKEGEIK